MYEHFIYALNTFIFISFGATLGAYLRFNLIYNSFPNIRKRYLITFLINIFSTFLLGYLVGIQDSNRITFLAIDTSLWILINTGFLGSFSTFSSFISDLFYLLRKKNYFEAFSLAIGSVMIGLLLAAFGYKFGYVENF
tara:strand:+ start:236 stop:649 length:414 start_codon:yes stop_codon:yes gene_type:complete